jgi:UPF0716 protein FxsA
MARKLIFAAFLLWIVLEVVALVAVGRSAGYLGALLLLCLGSVGGWFLLRGEGIALATRLARHVQRAQQTGVLPPLPVAESLPRFIAGVLLILPGFVSDVLAVAILLPPLRGWVVARVHGWISKAQARALREKGYTIDIEGNVVEPENGNGGGARPRNRLPPPDDAPPWLPPPAS